ncbi:hypothetical protein HRM2_10480 [Desulforapulum autotrophicum HRM2]|uniref:Uncharacterized protein n=1 Tax=Desulforapulum autotrophicum (strain ATCC 43914 / DSM 3382 / VKM B-1955 / HRM2) TaxID=177437 RepID=C0QL74_DESAH|nr:hypothetical protein HRM2_10480 [Desulforapulum autotrophicum HRM2]
MFQPKQSTSRASMIFFLKKTIKQHKIRWLAFQLTPTAKRHYRYFFTEYKKGVREYRFLELNHGLNRFKAP